MMFRNGAPCWSAFSRELVALVEPTMLLRLLRAFPIFCELHGIPLASSAEAQSTRAERLADVLRIRSSDIPETLVELLDATVTAKRPDESRRATTSVIDALVARRRVGRPPGRRPTSNVDTHRPPFAVFLPARPIDAMSVATHELPNRIARSLERFGWRIDESDASVWPGRVHAIRTIVDDGRQVRGDDVGRSELVLAPDSGELWISTPSDVEEHWLQRTLGNALAADPNRFAPSHLTDEPLLELGTDALSPAGIDGLERVSLTDIRLSASDDGASRYTFGERQLTSAACQELFRRGRANAVTFRLWLRSPGLDGVMTIFPPRHVVFERPEIAAPGMRFLRLRGFQGQNERHPHRAFRP